MEHRAVPVSITDSMIRVISVSEHSQIGSSSPIFYWKVRRVLNGLFVGSLDRCTDLSTLVPSNVVLKKFMRPSIYLGILVTTWGVIMTLHGVVQNFGGLLAVRLLLGVFEAGFFPGAV